MYSPSENAQAIQSKQMIADALFRLMNGHSYKEITITQICQEAQVVRQTFYRNFETKDDILEYYLDDIFREYVNKFYEKNADVNHEIMNFYKFIETKKLVFTQIEKNQLFFMVERSIVKNVSNFFDLGVLTSIRAKHLIPYVSVFISATICSSLSLWIRNGYKETTEDLKNMTVLFLSGLEPNKLDRCSNTNIINPS